MGVFDKLKNVFFEEEEEEIEEPIKKVKKPAIAKKIDLPEMPKVSEEKTQREIEIEEEVVEKIEKKGVSERDLRKPEGFKFPMDFEEEDFKEDTFEEKIEPVKEQKTVHTPKYTFDYRKEDNAYGGAIPYEGNEFKKEEKVFRPTPIISPIYGVLDKNYKKDDVVQKREVKSPSSYSKKVDLDSVREKAYGDLASDISLSLTEEPELDDIMDKDETSLYDLNENAQPAVSKVTVGDAEEYYNDLGLEYNIDYKDHAKEKATGRRTKKPESIEEEITEDDSDLEIENNLFDLIDSMYSDSDKE